jgi:hypothetical protein
VVFHHLAHFCRKAELKGWNVIASESAEGCLTPCEFFHIGIYHQQPLANMAVPSFLLIFFFFA